MFKISKMKYTILLAIALVTIIACKTNSSYDEKVLNELENAFNANPSDSTYDVLITKYLEIMQENQSDQKLVEQLLVKCAAASTKMDNCRQTVIFLNNLIKNHHERSDTPENILQIIACLRKIDKAYAADILAMSFAEAYPSHPKKNELLQDLQQQESASEYLVNLAKAIFPDSAGASFNKEIAFNYVDACEAYALVLPKSEQTPEFLFSAAQTAKLLQTYDKCISLFDWLTDKYPTHPKAESASFMKAFLFDNDLKDSATAHRFYKEFISKYPKSEFVDDAEVLINNLGKSEEQILKELQEKQKAQ